ncbi:MAG: cephalosporin hydroxylase family protein [Verrucomicrobia bacterium]|nr:cephalosporin hydroxylase family protein [Verrucomicrobiota bacterium]MBI3870104.1 cephalosporin hydroxylase family protein [Verrucomicrobiota bacterium]
MNPIEQFQAEVRNNIAGLRADGDLQALSRIWVREIARHKYAYNFSWLGRPAIQFPQDLVAMQEIIWRVRPGAIIETGIAHGGSLVFSASMLELLKGDSVVIGIDVDIRPHNRAEIEKHPLAHRIRMIQGSSVDPGVVAQARAMIPAGRPVLVVLDSNHTHEHVLKELQGYSPLVTRGSYLVVMDTLVEDMPEDLTTGRPWGKGNNPKTAVWEFLKTNDRFEIDKDMEAKLLITVAPDGYLRCVKD